MILNTAVSFKCHISGSMLVKVSLGGGYAFMSI